MAKNKKEKFSSKQKKIHPQKKRKINFKLIYYNIRKEGNNIKKESVAINKNESFFIEDKKYNHIIQTNEKEKAKKDTNYKKKISLTFYDTLKAFNWDSKTQKAVTSIFNQYQEFINKNYPNNKSKKLNEKKILENDQFFEENNIVTFLKSYKNFKSSTYNNRLSLFRRIIKVMTNNPFWDYIHASVQEKKNKKRKAIFDITKTSFIE